MITGKIRASYVHVFQPQTPLGGGEPKYSITMLIPKTDVNTLNQISIEMERAKQEGVQKVFGGKLPPIVKTPLYDGDGVRPSGEPFSEECSGHMVITASCRQKPGVVDINLQSIINPAEFYSGCYARVSLNFFAYNQNGNKGIGCGLNNIQKLEDGEPLGGRTTAEEDFGGTNLYQTGVYNAPAPVSYPAQAPYSAPAAAPQQTSYQGQTPYSAPAVAPQPMIDPITGRPMQQGGVMGI